MVIMSSPMVSHYLEFNEKFQNNKDLTVPSALGRQLEQLLARAQEASATDQDISPVLADMNPVNASIRPPIYRRHSSSAYVSRQSQLNTLVETKNLINAMIGGLETLTEEKFNRNRAFSENTALYSIDVEQQQPSQSTTSRYKTELCRPFEENGKCKYGEKCQFAHGKHELRHMVRHPKYKTELCRTYHTSGLCPYGPRCHFIHNQEEAALDAHRQTVGVKQTNPVVTPICRAQRQQKPANLQLTNPLRRLNSASFLPTNTNPLEPQSPFVGSDAIQFMPPSPINKTPSFNLSGPMSPREMQFSAGFEAVRGGSPPLASYAHGLYDVPLEDGVFEQSGSDSERESSNGSPPGFGNILPPAAPISQQRLPIFRCLSQS